MLINGQTPWPKMIRCLLIVSNPDQIKIKKSWFHKLKLKRAALHQQQQKLISHKPPAITRHLAEPGVVLYPENLATATLRPYSRVSLILVTRHLVLLHPWHASFLCRVISRHPRKSSRTIITRHPHATSSCVSDQRTCSRRASHLQKTLSYFTVPAQKLIFAKYE